MSGTGLSGAAKCRERGWKGSTRAVQGRVRGRCRPTGCRLNAEGTRLRRPRVSTSRRGNPNSRRAPARRNRSRCRAARSAAPADEGPGGPQDRYQEGTEDVHNEARDGVIAGDLVDKKSGVADLREHVDPRIADEDLIAAVPGRRRPGRRRSRSNLHLYNHVSQ